MRDTPIHLNGPFTLRHEQGGWTIYGRDGVRITELTGRLVDGSGRKDKYPDGVIRSKPAREEEANFVHAAMNAHVPRDIAALELALIAECERAMAQRDEFLKTGKSTAGHGGSHDTLFGFILRNHGVV